MPRILALVTLTAVAGLAVVPVAQAQQDRGWGTETTGFFGVQGAADFDGGGNVSTSRSFVGVGVLNRLDSGASVGLALGYGLQSYDFGGGATALWGDEESLSLPVQLELDGGDVFLAPQIRSSREIGASSSDSLT